MKNLPFDNAKIIILEQLIYHIGIFGEVEYCLDFYRGMVWATKQMEEGGFLLEDFNMVKCNYVLYLAAALQKPASIVEGSTSYLKRIEREKKNEYFDRQTEQQQAEAERVSFQRYSSADPSSYIKLKVEEKLCKGMHTRISEIDVELKKIAPYTNVVENAHKFVRLQQEKQKLMELPKPFVNTFYILS